MRSFKLSIKKQTNIHSELQGVAVEAARTNSLPFTLPSVRKEHIARENVE